MQIADHAQGERPAAHQNVTDIATAAETRLEIVICQTFSAHHALNFLDRVGQVSAPAFLQFIRLYFADKLLHQFITGPSGTGFGKTGLFRQQQIKIIVGSKLFHRLYFNAPWSVTAAALPGIMLTLMVRPR
ncbi:MAG: hypothetical protein M0P70_12545 [Desulfobulbaceae bacterium]|nr:hypothetical protein [Desulfobulbaceae bacterium]